MRKVKAVLVASPKLAARALAIYQEQPFEKQKTKHIEAIRYVMQHGRVMPKNG